MAAQRRVIFRRINGRVVPIAAARSAELTRHIPATAGGAAVLAGTSKSKGIKVNSTLKHIGTAAAVASGALGAATLFSSGKAAFWGGLVGGLALDAVSTGSSAAAVARGNRKNVKGAAKEFARMEAKNIVVGNAIFYGGILAVKKNREKIVGYGIKALNFVRKVAT
jgi:hypothetical protein